jgi:DNA polymerase-3 subunit beta
VRLTCRREELASTLASAARVTSAKSTIQILSHLLVSADEGRAEIAATDMELSLRVPLEAEISESGAVALPRIVGDIVRSMPEQDVVMDHRQNEGVVTLTAGRSEFSLNCLQASDFPELPRPDGEPLILPARQLIDSVEVVARAASRDETRPVLTGALVRLSDGQLTMVATDSYRLAVREAPIEGGPPEAVEAIVPARALTEIARLASTAGVEEVSVLITESQAAFGVGETHLTARLIDGQFPDHRQLVPDQFEHEVVFDRAELAAVLSRIGVLAQRNSPVRLAFSDGEVVISTVSDQVGSGTESLPVPFSGEPMEIGFNVEFLRAGVDSVGGDELRMGLISPLRPGLLRGGDDQFRYLLMPIRLNA